MYVDRRDIAMQTNPVTNTSTTGELTLWASGP